MESGGGGVQLFLSPGAAGRLRLRNCAHIAARPGTVRHARPQDDGSLELLLPLALAATAGAAPLEGLGQGSGGGAQQEQQQQQQQQQQGAPMSRLERAAAGAPQPPGSADITVDAGAGSGWAAGAPPGSFALAQTRMVLAPGARTRVPGRP